jgi:hypothetical protein
MDEKKEVLKPTEVELSTEVTSKADVVLTDGTRVCFDKRKIKAKEWRELFSKDQSDDDGWRVIGKFAGLTFEYVSDLSIYDWQILFDAAIKKVREPVDPNLLSESIQRL